MSATVGSRITRGVPGLLALALLAPALSAAQGTAPAPPQPGVAAEDRPMVEVAPLRCWWRTSTGAVAIGEPFEVRLTCAVLETETVQVVPDESRLTVAGVQLTPFEVVGGDHPADTRSGQRRFFQYRYTLRMMDPNEIGQDVSLPRLTILYRVQSRMAADQTLSGRDFVYLMPPLTVHVLSQVSEDASDIRDSADVGFERIDALRFRARLLDIGAIALLAAGLLLGVLSVASAVVRARPAASTGRVRVADRRVLAAVDTELSRIAREAAGGWTAALVGAAHAALRVIGAVALGRPVSEQPLASGESPKDGRLAIRGWMRGRTGVAVASPTTPADLARALAALPPDCPVARRSGLEALRDALSTFTAAQFTAPDAVLDGAALGQALEAGRAEATRLARERRWAAFGRAPASSWREGAARP